MFRILNKSRIPLFLLHKTLRMSFQLSHIPHYTTLQKFAARISGTILAKIILSSFILLLLNYVNSLFIGIDSFIRIQSIQCFTILYRSSQTTKEVSQVIIKCRFTFSNYMYCQNKTSSYKTWYYRFSTSNHQNIRTSTNISNCSWQRLR